jgi:hypothetical protein
MAAVLPFASSLLEKGKETLARVKDELVDDPLAWLVKILRIVGSVFLVVGFVLGTAGYYLKAAATTAANNEVGILGNIGQIFGNLKAPSFTPAAGGTAPLSFSLQGIQNFFGDVWQDVQGAGSDVAQAGGVMGTLAEDVGIALTDVAKAILAFVQHFPDLLWNGLVWGVGGALADVVNWLFPYLILIGAILVGISFAIWGIRAAWRGILKAGWDEAWGEKQAELRGKVSGFFRKVLHVKPAAPAVAHVESLESVGQIAPGPPALPGEIPVAIAAPAPIVGQEADAEKALPGLPEPAEGAPARPELESPAVPAAEPALVAKSVPAPEDLPLQEPPRRKELEKVLGDGYVEAKDRMRAALRTGASA